MQKSSIKKNNFSDNNFSDKVCNDKNIDFSFDGAFKELENVASLLSDNLDVSSEKITKIENRLRNLKTNLPYQMCVLRKQASSYKPLEVYHIYVGPYFLENYGYCTKTEWFLLWDVCEQSKSYRIIVKGLETDLGFVHYPEKEYEDFIELAKRTIYKKPLIECRLAIRLKFAKFIIPFIQAFTDYLRSYSASIASYNELKPESFEIEVEEIVADENKKFMEHLKSVNKILSKKEEELVKKEKDLVAREKKLEENASVPLSNDLLF